MRNVWDKSCRENQNVRFVVSKCFTKFVLFNEGLWKKNMVDPDRPQMTVLYGACALHTGHLRIQTHTQNV